MANQSSGLVPQLYTINSVKVQFPCKAYPSQLSMMDKILKGLDRSQNCLLESPTGSGKSLALLCSALAWQKTEYEKVKQEEDSLKEGEECCCQASTACHAGTAKPALSTVNVADPNNKSTVTDETAITNTSVIDCDNEDDLDDFKTDNKKSRRSLVQVEANPVLQADASSPVALPSEAREDCNPDKENCICKCKTVKKKRVPKIYFGTRTHKQIAQIIRELGKTAYSNTRMTILSSREHTCIHPEIAPYPNKNEACKELLDGIGCPYFERARRVFSHSFMEMNRFSQIWDVEDIVLFGKKHKACCYFGVRQLRETADIIFCPYNYLIDPNIRKSMDISLNSQIVILDEAHNIEDSSREAASYSVSQQQLLEAMQDLEYVANVGIKPADHRTLRAMCADLGQLIERNKDTASESSAGFDAASRIWTGIEIVAQLELLGINVKKFADLQVCYSNVMARDEETNDNTYLRRRQESKKDEVKAKSATTSVLDGLFMVLGFIFKDNMKFVDDYRVVIVKSMGFTNAPTEGRWLNKKRRAREMAWTYTLNFWCMNPALAFTHMSSGVRSIILTSGTLAPMTSFQSELGIPFLIQLEANHVISSNQVWVGCLSRGPSNHQLLGSYQNAETWAYQDEIGNILLEVCQTVPFGVLCFLPSYKSLEKLSGRWQDTGLLDKIRTFKTILIEPRASRNENFDNILKEYYDVIRQCTEQGLQEDNRLQGALFLAVCRGKVSEGMDFADNNARAVLLVGIPYPNIRDTQIDLKKKYNDARSVSKGLLCGREWYDIQAYRAMNQALGRCIRHRRDWGSLILIDERFAKNPQKYTTGRGSTLSQSNSDILTGLSKWVRQRVQYFNMFHGARSSLQRFTQDHVMEPVYEDASFMSTPSRTISDSSMSSNSTPLKPIQNFETPTSDENLKEMTVGRRRTSANKKDVSMSHGDIRCFIHPVGLMKTNQHMFADPNASLSSTPIGFESVAIAKLSGTDSGFSQAGGFIAESSQAIEITQLQPSIVQKLFSDNEPVLVLQNAHVAHALGDMKFPISQISFDPVMASTQLPVETKVLSSKELGRSSYFCSAVADIHTLNDNAHSKLELEKRSNLVVLKVAEDFGSTGFQNTATNLQKNNLGFDGLGSFHLKGKIEDMENKDTARSHIITIEDDESHDESNFDRKEPCLDITDYRSDSPDLFDCDEVNTENVDAVLEELSAKNYDTIPVKKTVDDQVQRFGCQTAKDLRDVVNDPVSKSSSCHVDSNVLMESESSLSAKLLRRKKTLQPQQPANPTSSVSGNSREQLRSTAIDKEVRVCRVDGDTGGRRKSLRMKRKKMAFDETSSQLKSKQRNLGVDFLDEMDQESAVKGGTKQLNCPTCNASLVDKKSFSSTDIQIHETYRPEFWKESTSALSNDNTYCKRPALSISKQHFNRSALINQKPIAFVHCPGVTINSQWNEDDGCCTQPVYCGPCMDTDSTTWLGVEIMATSGKHCPQLRPGQVWLVSQCLTSS